MLRRVRDLVAVLEQRREGAAQEGIGGVVHLLGGPMGQLERQPDASWRISGCAVSENRWLST